MCAPTCHIYVLRCEPGDKYYVGKTSRDVETRFLEHATDHPTAWTRRHAPIEVHESHEVVHDATRSGLMCFEEDRYVKEYMLRFGIDNVRGGSYSSVVLNRGVKYMIQRELDTANDACFRCHRKGHFVSQCYAATYSDGRYIGSTSYEKRWPFLEPLQWPLGAGSGQLAATWRRVEPTSCCCWPFGRRRRSAVTPKKLETPLLRFSDSCS